MTAERHRGFFDFLEHLGDLFKVFLVDNLRIVFRAEYADIGDFSFAYFHAFKDKDLKEHNSKWDSLFNFYDIIYL